MASSAPAAPGSDTTNRPRLPSTNPIPLSASQEAQVRDLYYARVRRHCGEEIKAFADCARAHTLTVGFACRDANHAMNGCMQRHATRAEQDAAREEWFAGRAERARARAATARRKTEQELFLREWWGLPERDREERRREEEKGRREERVGGFRAGKGGQGEGRGEGERER